MNSAMVRRRRRAKLSIDRAIRNCAPTANHRALEGYRQLVAVVQQKSDLLTPLVSRRRDPAHVAQQSLIGLSNLAKFQTKWARSCEDWCPAGESSRQVFNSLVRFLLDEHPVPGFMLSCWLQDSEGIDLQHQQWYLHFARVGTIRGISTLNRMTRQQAECFAESPDHVSIEEALSRGVAGFVGQPRKLRPQQVTQRRWKRRQAFKQRWWRGDWPALSIPDFQTQNHGESLHGYRSWSIRQIVRRNDLIREGTELQHCVRTYQDKCKSGRTSIWSLKSHGLTTVRRIITIELDPRQRQVITALGRHNSAPPKVARSVMEQWARLNELSIASWV